MFRLVCQNGTVDEVRAPPNGNIAQNVINGAFDVLDGFVTLTGCSRHIGPRLMQFFVAVDQAVVPIETLQFHTRWC